MDNTVQKQKISLKTTIFLVVLVVIYIAGAVIAFNHLQKSLFLERSTNTNLLMDKITQNVETGIDTRWNSIRHLANQFYDTDFADLAAMEEWLGVTKSYRNENITGLFTIDENAICYTSSGHTFNWQAVELLLGKDEEVYLSSEELRISENENLRIFFLRRLETPKVIEGKRITHLALSSEMSFVDPFFNTAQFGDSSVAFILRRSGTQLYRQEKSNPISGVYNVISAFERAEFDYGATYESFQSDIAQGKNNCIRVTYEEKTYYLVYHTMDTNDWMSMMMIPEADIGSAARTFMRSIVVSIALIAFGGFAIFLTIFFMESKKNNKHRQLMNDQLLRTAQAERDANQAKTQFLSSMSHDIRTPMNAIVGMTALAVKNIEDKEYVKHCLSNVTLASNHLLTLINDILDISKVESGKMSLNPIVFSLSDAVTNLVNIVRSQIHAKNQKFEIRVHNITEENLFADEVRLNQILINLLSNAVKYTPEGGSITVDIKEERIPDLHNYVRLIYIVEDTGIGMSQEFQKTMYTSFAREQGHTTARVQGTGLGLTICKQMVDLMDGSIVCESEEGKGTRFTVTLDLPIAEQAEEEWMLPPMHVLLVDDDAIFLETASDTLCSLGLTVDVVSLGIEAIKMVEEKHSIGQDYPVVIIDWRLQDIDGIEATRRIRAKVGDDVPIILISAYEAGELEEAAKAAGASGFLSKPFFASSVHAQLSEILGLHKEEVSSEADVEKSLEDMTILVAEDNDLNWEIVYEILKMYNITCIRAENGRKCVDMLLESAENEYDMVLMDIQMPIMDGYEATKLIRRSERPSVKNIPIVAMTADAFADDIQRSIDAGMNAHIAKPININNLLTIIGNRGGKSLPNHPVV